MDYKEELLASLQYVYKEHSPEFLYYFTLNELFGDQLDTGVERFEKDSTRFKKTEIGMNRVLVLTPAKLDHTCCCKSGHGNRQ